MSDIGRLERRLSAIERVVVDGDAAVASLADTASLAADLETVVDRLDAHERRIAELEGRLDALEGIVGNVESVNGGIERRANAAVAAVDRLEYRIDDLERALDDAIGLDGRSPVEARDGTADRDVTAAESGQSNDGPYGRSSSGTTERANDVDESAVGPPPVERTVAEIAAGPIDDGSDCDGTSLQADDRPARPVVATEGSRPEARATQGTIDCRLGASSDRTESSADDRSAEPGPVDGDQPTHGDGGPIEGESVSDGPPSAGDDHRSESDDGPASGLLASLRARLP